jgi:hypothetical protein
MAIQQANGTAATATSTKNKGGAVVKAGTSTMLDNVSSSRTNVGVFASTVIPSGSTVVDYATSALTSGTFAYNNQKPVAKRYTIQIAGTSNTFLQSGAARPELVRSIQKLETLRTRRLTTAIRAGYWNIYSGTFSTSPTNAVDNWYGVSGSGISTSTDYAAAPTQAAPGQIVYMSRGKNPVYGNDANSAYKPRSIW